MSDARTDPEAVVRLAAAAERLRAAPAPADALPDAGAHASAEQALERLRTACDELAATDLEVRRARTEIAWLAAEAAARRAPPDAA